MAPKLVPFPGRPSFPQAGNQLCSWTYPPETAVGHRCGHKLRFRTSVPEVSCRKLEVKSTGKKMPGFHHSPCGWQPAGAQGRAHPGICRAPFSAALQVRDASLAHLSRTLQMIKWCPHALET